MQTKARAAPHPIDRFPAADTRAAQIVSPTAAPPIQRGNVQVIANPISGRAGSRGVMDALSRKMSQAGLAVNIHTTRGPGEARDVARRSGEKKVAALVVCGGDGTISEVVNGLAGSDVPVLLIPGGTENLLARYFGFQLDAAFLWQVFRRGRTINLDVALHNGQRFLLVAGAGPDAEVVRLLSQQRRGHISYWNYVAPILQTLRDYQHPSLSVEADGILVHQGPAWVLVGNVPQYAMNLQLLHQARPDDGLLDLCIVPGRSNLSLLWHLWKALLHEHQDSPTVIYRQARHIRIWSDDRVPLEVDGDVAGWLPAEFRLAEEKARFIIPSQWQMPNCHRHVTASSRDPTGSAGPPKQDSEQKRLAPKDKP